MRLVDFVSVASVLRSRFIPVLCLAVLPFAAPCRAGAILYNDPPDTVNAGGFNMVGGRLADSFSLSATATIGDIRFWNVNFSGSNNLGTQISAVAWGIYADASGAPGTLLASGASATTSTLFLNQTFAKFYQVDFSPVGIGALGAGAYWLEVHDGSSFSDSSQPVTFWALGTTHGAQAFDFCTLPCGVPQSPPVLGAGDNQLAFELFDNSSSTVPEPATAGSVLAGIAGLVLVVRRNRNTAFGRTLR